MPCHVNKVDNPAQHTHHKADGPGGKCISCHMPTTEFARMHRTDHSMLPPAPAATIAFQSPNACNLCHHDKTPQWANQWVRKWRKRDYQAVVLHRGGLIQAARKGDWRRLQEMVDYITGPDRDAVFAASLINLLRASGDPRVVPVWIRASRDPSPLVRAAAAEALQAAPTKESAKALATATGDSYRLVRIHAAASLAGFPEFPLTDDEKKSVESATREYLDSMLSRPDQWNSHYNLGNYHLVRNHLKEAVSAYGTALKMEPHAVLAMVNQSMAYARAGETQNAHEVLKKAFKTAPESAVVNFNLALAEAQTNDLEGAEKHLRRALKADPQMAEAAYNLCILLSKENLDEAVQYCQNAADTRQDQPRYAYTLAFYQQQKGDFSAATEVLERLLGAYPGYGDAYLLLGGIYEKQGKGAEAVKTYNRGLSAKEIPERYRIQLKIREEALK